MRARKEFQKDSAWQGPKGPFREALERKGHATPLPLRSISARLLAVGLFVSFGEFEKHDFLALVVDIVQHPVRADSQPILSGKL
jgi:hypothetical protein